MELDNDSFNSSIQDKKLIDIETSNGLHTWNNRQGGSHQIDRWLDHSLIV
jgi:hypothetical protein